MPNTYKLTYFNLTARAETIRLIFAAGGVKFEDNRIEFSAWGAMKPTTPWGSLPILEVNGKTVVGQSMALARFAAREAGLAGSNSLDQALADSVTETISEMREKIFSFVMKPEGAEKTEAANNYSTNVLPGFLANIDKFLGANNGGKGFLVGSKMTWADLHLFTTVEFIRQTVPTAAPVLANYPRIEQLVARVAAVPKVAEYLKKRG